MQYQLGIRKPSKHFFKEVNQENLCLDGLPQDVSGTLTSGQQHGNLAIEASLGIHEYMCSCFIYKRKYNVAEA